MKLKPCWTQWENANVWLGHVLRRELLLHDITEGRMRGTSTKSRKRMHLLSDLKKEKYVALKRIAEDGKEWQKLIRVESHNLLLSRLLAEEVCIHFIISMFWPYSTKSQSCW